MKYSVLTRLLLQRYHLLKRLYPDSIVHIVIAQRIIKIRRDTRINRKSVTYHKELLTKEIEATQRRHTIH